MTKELIIGIIGSVIVTGVIPMVNESAQQDERDVVIRTIMGEALDQGLPGMTAVAETIRNRAAMHNMSPSDVVMKPYQYSFWNDKEKANSWIQKYGTGDAYQMASHAYEQAFNEGSQLTDGATHYLNKMAILKQTGGKLPSWTDEYPFKVRIGSHDFYRGA